MTNNSNARIIQMASRSNVRVLQDPPPLMLPPRKCAEALNLPEHTVRQWLKTGVIKGVPCGKKMLLNVASVRRMLEEV